MSGDLIIKGAYGFSVLERWVAMVDHFEEKGPGPGEEGRTIIARLSRGVGVDKTWTVDGSGQDLNTRFC